MTANCGWQAFPGTNATGRRAASEEATTRGGGGVFAIEVEPTCWEFQAAGLSIVLRGWKTQPSTWFKVQVLPIEPAFKYSADHILFGRGQDYSSNSDLKVLGISANFVVCQAVKPAKAPTKS